MNITITGGSGYIGTWLTKELLKDGHQIRILDVVPPISSISEKVEYIKADIKSKDEVTAGIKDSDVVYHLAAVVSKLRGLEDREVCIQTNVNGTLYILEACRKYDVNRLIYMGTSEVLGEPLYTPTDERHRRAPMTTYGITKCAGEDLCHEYYHAYGLNAVMPRLYMVYGIDDVRPIKYHNVIIKFIWSALHDRSPMAFKACIRNFLYITDCAKALSLFLTKGKPGEIYDICDRPEYAVTMEELANMVIELCGKSLKPELRDPPPTDTKVKIPSGYKTYAELGWSPEVRLEDGLKKVIEWMKATSAEFS
ncbi:MAG: NAD-dependent epimerase/dehydratase family protein [Thermoplasmata archaeon]|nr:NAD-dependent epimerase/dehydratase family protein [Thermoplasmata archaeon]